MVIMVRIFIMGIETEVTSGRRVYVKSSLSSFLILQILES